jgi:hypothetical protein
VLLCSSTESKNEHHSQNGKSLFHRLYPPEGGLVSLPTI